MITPTTEIAAEKNAASPVPTHFKNLFSALQVRKLDRTSSAAVVMEIAGPNNSSIIHSSIIMSDERQLQLLEHAGKRMGRTRPTRETQSRTMPMRVAAGEIRTDLDVGRSSYSCN